MKEPKQMEEKAAPESNELLSAEMQHCAEKIWNALSKLMATGMFNEQDVDMSPVIVNRQVDQSVKH